MTLSFGLSFRWKARTGVAPSLFVSCEFELVIHFVVSLPLRRTRDRLVHSRLVLVNIGRAEPIDRTGTGAVRLRSSRLLLFSSNTMVRSKWRRTLSFEKARRPDFQDYWLIDSLA